MCNNMISSYKIIPWTVAICCLITADCWNVTDQQTSESQPEQVAILKQLRKVNDDGSYTYGYEAGDGSYKVETRDVLGNVRGTFGFVDANGEIKQVTYSSSNGTGFKATTVSPLQEHVSVVQNIPRTNRSSSMKRPAASMSYTTSTESSSTSSSSVRSVNPKLTVVQTIPRNNRVKATTTASTTTSTTTESPAKAILGHYIKASKYRPRLNINEQQKPITTSNAQESMENRYSQIARPTVEVKTPTPRKIMVIKNPVDHTLRPITEEFEEKSQSPKSSHTGNTFRRQLQEERLIKTEESSENTSDENSDVYMGSLSTTRPLFTTSTVPKIIQQIRTDPSKIIYQQAAPLNEENTSSPAYDSVKYRAKKIYEIDNEVAMKEHLTPAQLHFRAVSLPSPVPQREYILKQSTDEPIHIRHQPDQIIRDLSPTILMPAPENSNEEGTIYSTSSIDTILSRQQAADLRQPSYPETMDPNNADFTRNIPTKPEELPLPSSSPLPSVYPAHPVPSTLHTPHHSHHRNKYIRSRNLPRLIPYQQQEYVRQSRPNNLKPVLTIDQQDYSEHPYRDNILPPEAPSSIAPPLSRRDFRILLRHLLASQYSTRALNHPRTYLDDALYDQQPRSTYQSSYNVRPSQHALIYNEPNLVPITYSERVNRVMNGDSSKIIITNENPALYQNMHYQTPNYYDPIYIKRVYREKIYDQDMNNGAEANGDEILPPPIREALLLRMLQLAIGNGRSVLMGAPPVVSNSASSITTVMPVTTSIYRKLGPVRSVQVITDDESRENDSMSVRKKI